MKNILVVHNPTAGDSDIKKEDILNRIRKNGREVVYVSTEDEEWSNFSLKDEDLIILAGGDGTVQKLAKILLQKTDSKIAVPIYLLPAGTANNIAATVNISSPRNFEIETTEEQFTYFDHGKITGIPEHPFFLEGVGFGVFPELIRTMKSAGEFPNETSEEKLKRTLRTLKDLAEKMKPQMVELELDGSLVKGNYLMAEVQNTRFIGPKLELAPVAEPGDGLLDLVLVGPDQREQLLEYIDSLIEGTSSKGEIKKFAESKRVKKVRMTSSWDSLHVDDDFLSNEKNFAITAEAIPGTFKFA